MISFCSASLSAAVNILEKDDAEFPALKEFAIVAITSTDGTEYHLDLSKMEDAINKGRGYYEFVAKIDGVEKIFRFNLEAFRNNYTMSDLPKMQLTYYGIKVGQIDKSDLRVEKEFEFGTGKASKRADYTGITSQIEGSSKIDVYDVVLAGVIENNEQELSESDKNLFDFIKEKDKETNIKRAIIDYIAGQTDQYFLNECMKNFG